MDNSQRIKKLRYREQCTKLYEKIHKVSPINLGTAPLSAAKKLDFLFLSVIPDEKKRETKLRLLFQGKFSAGDDVYLRIIYDTLKKLKAISYQLTEKYHQELPLQK